MSLTRESILAMADRLRTTIGPTPPRMRLIQTDAAVTSKWRKDYPKSRAKNPSHLKRMQNKWRKRYGLVMTPAILRATCPFTGDQMVYVHPMLWREVQSL